MAQLTVKVKDTQLRKNMKTLDEIKDEVSKESSYSSWFDVHPEDEGKFIDKVAERYSEERLKEWREKLKDKLIEANNGSKYPMANAELFNELIDSL
jgi:hypothetical protein